MSANTGNNTIRFTDDATDSFIEMEWYDYKTWVNGHYVDPDNCKLFMLLLKTALLKMKKKGCSKYQQLVLEDDWDAFIKENPEWKIILKYSEMGSLLIECDIDDAPELIIDGFLRNNNE
jgi:hypothetical protein